ncbi:hypothetical protein CCACVL1_01882, partial [Corchorus capsularis]
MVVSTPQKIKLIIFSRFTNTLTRTPKSIAGTLNGHQHFQISLVLNLNLAFDFTGSRPSSLDLQRPNSKIRDNPSPLLEERPPLAAEEGLSLSTILEARRLEKEVVMNGW